MSSSASRTTGGGGKEVARGTGAAREQAAGAMRAGGKRVGGYDKGGAGSFGRGKAAGRGGRATIGRSPLRVALEVGGGKTSTRGRAECSKKEKSWQSGKLIQQIFYMTNRIFYRRWYLPATNASGEGMIVTRKRADPAA